LVSTLYTDGCPTAPEARQNVAQRASAGSVIRRDRLSPGGAKDRGIHSFGPTGLRVLRAFTQRSRARLHSVAPPALFVNEHAIERAYSHRPAHAF